MSPGAWGEFVAISLYWGVVASLWAGAGLTLALWPLPLLRAPARRFAERVTEINESVGKIAAWLLLLMTALVAMTVAGGFVFGRGATVLSEGALFAHGALFLLAAPMALASNDHVRVDIFQRRYGPKTAAIVDILGGFLLLGPLSFVIAWFAYDYISASWEVTERSAETGGLPGVFLLKTLIPVFAFLLALQSVAQSLKASLALFADDAANDRR